MWGSEQKNKHKQRINRMFLFLISIQGEIILNCKNNSSSGPGYLNSRSMKMKI